MDTEHNIGVCVLGEHSGGIVQNIAAVLAPASGIDHHRAGVASRADRLDGALVRISPYRAVGRSPLVRHIDPIIGVVVENGENIASAPVIDAGTQR